MNFTTNCVTMIRHRDKKRRNRCYAHHWPSSIINSIVFAPQRHQHPPTSHVVGAMYRWQLAYNVMVLDVGENWSIQRKYLWTQEICAYPMQAAPEIRLKSESLIRQACVWNCAHGAGNTNRCPHEETLTCMANCKREMLCDWIIVCLYNEWFSNSCFFCKL